MIKDHTNLLQSDSVENMYEINHLLMIKEEVIKNNTTIRQLKDHSVYILNDVKYILHGKPLEMFVGYNKKWIKSWQSSVID